MEVLGWEDGARRGGRREKRGEGRYARIAGGIGGTVVRGLIEASEAVMRLDRINQISQSG